MDARARFEDYTERLLRSVSADPDVVGLVLLGSTADTSRVDAWSDHDFYLLVAPGLQERFRQDLSWLPDHERIAFSVRETEHGLKVVYEDGAVLEFAVASVAEAATFGGLPRRIVLDRADVEGSFGDGRGTPDETDDLTRFRLFLSIILIGVGRARRGEELAGGQLVRTSAGEHLLWLLRHHPPLDDVGSGSPDAADLFNPWRRLENAHPRLGASLGDALAQRTEPCGLALLDIAESRLSQRWDGYRAAELMTVRRALATLDEG